MSKIDGFMLDIKKHENKVITQVIEMILQRRSKPKDFKRISKMGIHGTSTYHLLFDGLIVGCIVFDLSNAPKISVRFEPQS